MNIDPKAAPTMDHRSVLELDAKDSDVSNNSDGCVTEQEQEKKKNMSNNGHSTISCVGDFMSGKIGNIPAS